ncbi:MAG: two-component system response regulator [Candidatus Rokubacteria bacterium 13_1_40CM_69_27]|nr:MAG: two-component system response regulator [Candidatus Rokubacteria bacterium 13_1_40CM_69_27]OLC36863.1 MAG: two-component system response regulator [Candidatus Rokubacteria bacterium 13_1_40CM_4_69_5]
MSTRILIADDEDSLRWVLEKGLRQVGYEVTAVKDGEEAIQAFESGPFDLVFLDVRMPGIDGLAALERLRAIRPDVYVVVMTAHGTMDTAIKAMQRGAYDYLAKPFDLDEVLLLTERALAAGRLTQEVARLRRGLQEVREFSALIGRHPRMQEVYKTIGRIAGTDVTVLLRGESGTGKELVARAIHHYSRRSGRPFVAVSCAAIPGTLLESEMFGHERGAFTDAKERRLGKFEMAHGGTLYLDEIGDMPLELQAKLLRALQERTIERVGGHEPIPVDVRVLAATNRDLEALMKEAGFREDLYYRLNVVALNLPPLRERRRDVPLLVEHFLAKYADELGERGVAPEALDRLVGHDWPGNVRELENVVQRAMVLATTGVILPEHLPIGPVSAAASVAVDASLEEIIERKLMECVRGLRQRSTANLYDLMVGLVEKPLLRAVLRETEGNQVRAAQILGINRNTLRKKLTEHGINPEELEHR